MKIQFTAGPIALDLIESGAVKIAGLTAEGALVSLDLEGVEAEGVGEVIATVAGILREEAGARVGAERFALESVARELSARIDQRLLANTAEIPQQNDQESHSLPTGDETTSNVSQQNSDATTTEGVVEHGKQAQQQPQRRRRS